MTHRKPFWTHPSALLAPFAALALAFVGACSSSQEQPPPVHVATPCSDDLCKAGNVCAGEPAECHLKCIKHSDCPHGYACGELAAPSDGGMLSVCVPAEISTSEGGYGTQCGDDYAKCGEGFVCPGNHGDTDTTCTKLDGCESDAECPAAYWCGSVRDRVCIGDRECKSDADCKVEGSSCTAVDAEGKVKRCIVPTFCHTSPDDCPVAKRPKDAPEGHTYRTSCSSLPDTSGDVMLQQRRACLPRSYCSPCETHADCTEPTAACIDTGNGEKFCSVQCAPSGFTCDPSSECKAVGDDFYCAPKSGSCKGDGSSCSTCRNDADCGEGGLCYVQSGSRERWCMQPCGAGDACPDTPGGMPQLCCTTPESCGSFLNYCVPDYYPSVSDTRYAMGCWITPCTKKADCQTSEQAMKCELSCDLNDPMLPPGFPCPSEAPKVCVPSR